MTRTHLGIAYTADGAKRHHRTEVKRELCIMACVFCRDPAFHAWLIELGGRSDDVVNDAGAKAYILSVCCVDSRNDLDRDPAAAERFHEFVRKPFVAWKEARRS